MLAGIIVPRSADHGGDIKFSSYEDLEQAFANQDIHPGDLKAAVEPRINKLLAPIIKHFEDPKLKELTAKAYPPPVKAGSKFLLISDAYNFNFKNSVLLFFFINYLITM